LERKLNNISTLLEKVRDLTKLVIATFSNVICAQLCPQEATSSTLDSRDEPVDPSPKRSLIQPAPSFLPSHDPRASPHDVEDDSSDDEVPEFFQFTHDEHLDPASNQYFGKSSHLKFARRAFETKTALIGRPLGVSGRRPEYWCIPWVSFDFDRPPSFNAEPV
jgi:hypothetical protein